LGKYEIQRPESKVVYLNYDAANKDQLIARMCEMLNGVGMLNMNNNGLFRYEQPTWKLTHDNAYFLLRELCTGRSLCIIDSLRSCFEGIDENSSEVEKFITLANKVSQETECVICFVAHQGKTFGDKGKDDIDSIRGSSAFSGAAGGIWKLEKTDKDRILRISCIKNRYGFHNPISYRYDPIGIKDEELQMYESVKMVVVNDEKPMSFKEIYKSNVALYVADGEDPKLTVIEAQVGCGDKAVLKIREELIRERFMEIYKKEGKGEDKRTKYIKLLQKEELTEESCVDD
jgi:hypothetical protein